MADKVGDVKKYIDLETLETFNENDLQRLYNEFLANCESPAEWTFAAWKKEATGKNGTLETLENYKKMGEI